MDLNTIIPWIQILLSIVLVVLVLLQSSESGLGALGGGDAGGGTHTKRGFEKTLFNATIVVSILFGIFAVAVLVIA